MTEATGLLDTYRSFFDLDMWAQVLTDPVSWGLIGTLVILEGLLSADNALVLAVMVRPLPLEQRKKALFYGLLGAYAFRFLAIGVGVYLIQLWWVKLFGAGYLAWLALHYFWDRSRGAGVEEEMEEVREPRKGGVLIRLFGQFWGTVALVELMDIAFSIDSVLAAFGVSSKIWVLLLGGMLGVLMMRGVAGVFLKLIERVPELEATAYVLILIISARMAAGTFGYELSQTAFFLILLAAFAGAFLLHMVRKHAQKD